MIGFRAHAAITQALDSSRHTSTREIRYVFIYAAVVAPLIVGAAGLSGMLAELADQDLRVPVRSGVGVLLVLIAGIIARPGINWLQRRDLPPKSRGR